MIFDSTSSLGSGLLLSLQPSGRRILYLMIHGRKVKRYGLQSIGKMFHCEGYYRVAVVGSSQQAIVKGN